VSVGVDRCMNFWDLRAASSPIIKLTNLHDSDINSVDWNPFDQNILATGSNDKLIKLVDIRRISSEKMSNPVCEVLRKHHSKVQTVRFSPFNSKRLVSAGD
jgi:peroxin-7